MCTCYGLANRDSNGGARGQIACGRGGAGGCQRRRNRANVNNKNNNNNKQQQQQQHSNKQDTHNVREKTREIDMRTQERPTTKREFAVKRTSNNASD